MCACMSKLAKAFEVCAFYREHIILLIRRVCITRIGALSGDIFLDKLRCFPSFQESRGFKDIITKTAKFKEFPGLENKFQNSKDSRKSRTPGNPVNIVL